MTAADSSITPFKYPLYICPPMVKQSDLAFRLLVRKYGCNLTYSQMYPSKAIQNELPYDTHHSDWPFIVQLCGNDPVDLVRAGKLVSSSCDAIDLNFGCPQSCAKAGHFGAYLLDEPDLIIDIITQMVNNINIPITCKIRILETEAETLRLCQRIEQAGCTMLAVHGRKRAQRQHRGNVDYTLITKIKQKLMIPVIVNGGIRCLSDGVALLEQTRCDGMMVATALLKNPAFYHGVVIDEITLICEYLELISQYFPRNPMTVRDHIVRILGREEIKQFRELDGLLHNRAMVSATQYHSWFSLFLNASKRKCPNWYKIAPILSLKEIKNLPESFKMSPTINMIVAATKSNGIGINGGLPWKIKQDMDHFRNMTTNYNRQNSQSKDLNVCIMGRITWESIPKKFRPLKDRINIVISRNPTKNTNENVLLVSTMQEAIDHGRKMKAPSIWIIGGQQIYSLAEPFCDQIFLTRIDQDIQCDAYFEIKMDQFSRLKADEIKNEIPDFNSDDIQDGVKFSFQIWKRL